MPDPDPAPAPVSGPPPDPDPKRSLLQRLVDVIRPGPETTRDLMDTLAVAERKGVVGAESRFMLEGVLRLADMTAGDAMVAAPRMNLLDIEATYETLLGQVIRTAHSRFPVYQDERENIIGILLAKDLLKLQRAPKLNLRTLLRPAVFIPESKGLNDLLREFRETHNHLAIVVDEFGRTAGLITIEDVLEEIVGEIEDEFDTDDSAGDIFALADGSWRVAGTTEVEQINAYFGTDLGACVDSDLEVAFETIGGLVAHELGHVPVRGEAVRLGSLDLVVLHTRGGAVRWFKVSRATTAGAA